MTVPTKLPNIYPKNHPDGDVMLWLNNARCSWRILSVAAALALSTATEAAQYDPGEDPPFATALLIEAETGAVLYEYNADVRRSPASTQKLLLQLVVMDAVDAGLYSLSDSVFTSAWASRIGGSQVFLRQGEVFPLSELMAAIVISSANDACAAVAEHIGGSVDGFVALMNAKAAELGLDSTRVVNVHGLDDTPAGEGNRTTAHDLAAIARALLHHPQILEWSATRIRPFRGGEFTLYTTNRLVGRFRGLDGLKTGFTQRAGFNLVATAERQDMRLISVLMGGRTEKQRERETAQLLSWGFNHFTKGPIAVPGETLGAAPLDWGIEPEVSAVLADTVIAVLSEEQRQRIKRDVELPTLLDAPVTAGDSVGTLQLSLDDHVLARVTLVAGKTVARMSLWEKLMSHF
ncbi:MAG: D-alanyl-D-alanine carboxypeptidase [bacterium]|nr:D-alanyl-D-alanine carboxypeptidase [bacterium]